MNCGKLCCCFFSVESVINTNYILIKWETTPEKMYTLTATIISSKRIVVVILF